MKILIKDATVITVDETRNVFSPGSVLIDGSDIEAVGAGDELAAGVTPEDTIIDARGKVVLPGFCECSQPPRLRGLSRSRRGHWLWANPASLHADECRHPA